MLGDNIECDILANYDFNNQFSYIYIESEKDGMPLQNAKGFIAPHQDEWGTFWSAYPTVEEDVKAYINLAMNSSLEEVEQKYTDYPDIVSKYKLMKKLINELGYIE